MSAHPHPLEKPESQESSVARHFAALGVGLLSAGASWVLGFGMLASWNGALGRFEDRHGVLSILLGVSTMFLGVGPAFIGARALVAPDSASGIYEYDPMGNRVRVGSEAWQTSAGSAIKWLAFGWAYNVVVGVLFYLGGR